MTWGRKIRVWRGQLPHWEVEGGKHFFTIRTHGSLPAEVVDKLNVVSTSLGSLEPQSAQFLSEQRKLFRLMETHLDGGMGFAPFAEPPAASLMQEYLNDFSNSTWDLEVWVIMPNHIHFLTGPLPHGAAGKTRSWIAKLKGRSARGINQRLGRSGKFWQKEWFDRWARNESEAAKISQYIVDNPVKAGLVKRAGDYPWVKAGPAK